MTELRPFSTSDLPYEPLRFEDGVVYLHCPRCRVKIEITERKDINSFTFAEYEHHYLAEHGADDGLVLRDGHWFRLRQKDPRPFGKAW